MLTWSSSGWKYGGLSDTTATNDRITSYALVDFIVRYVMNNPRRYPNVREIVVAGHSTGKCLDADSGEDHLNGGTVQRWSCHFGSNQSRCLERRNSEEV